MEQFLAGGREVDSFLARVSNTFATQGCSNDTSILLLLISFPHGGKLVTRASNHLRDSLHVALGQLAAIAILEELLRQSAFLIFSLITSGNLLGSASSNGRVDQKMGRPLTGDYCARALLASSTSGVAVEDKSVPFLIN